MVDNKKNEKVSAIIFGLINVGLIFLSSYYLIFAFCVPIFTAIKLWDLDDKNKPIFLFVSGLILALIDIRLAYFLMLPMLISGLVIFYIIKRNKTDKDSIKILTLIFSVLSLAIIGYLYTKTDFKIDDLVKNVEQVFVEQDFKFDKEIIRKSLKTMPSLIVFFSLIYSMISLKLVRNYLNYKDENIRDLRIINTIRIEVKDLKLIFASLIISVVLSKLLRFSEEFIYLNSIMTLKLIFSLNGILLIDYFVTLRKNKISRVFNWFLMFILFSYAGEIIALIGFIDTFVNFRKKVRIRWKIN